MSSKRANLFNPGPVDPSVLYMQEQHISDPIWDFQEKEHDKINNLSSNIGIKKWILSKAQRDSVTQAGFGFLLRPGNVVRADVALLNALIERWRPETNTFHLPVGECTITLEDVVNILGIPGSGTPIVDKPLKEKQNWLWINTFKLTGLKYKDLESDGIKMLVLRERFEVLAKDHTEEDEELQVKAFLLVGIGSVLFPQQSNNRVHGKYIKFVSELAQIGSYAWSAAVLAHTYRALYKVTIGETKMFDGCTTLLQVWAWLRVSVGRPLARPDSEIVWPRVNVYAYDSKGKDTYDRGRQETGPHHTMLVFFRGELDRFGTHGVFNWMPYESLPNKFQDNRIFYYARDLGRSRVPLIHFSEIEYQLPDRVLRQFGMPLEIPENPRDRLDFRRYRARKKSDFERIDPFTVYSDEINEWMKTMVRSQDGVYHGNPAAQASLHVYMQWYRGITRLRIHPGKLSEEPSDKFTPRSVIDESSMYSLVERAVPLVSAITKYIPETENEMIHEAKNWEETYTSFTQSEIDPSYQYNASQSGGPQSQQSWVTDLFSTPEYQNASLKSKGAPFQTVPAPPAPAKDKGKRPVRHKWPEGGPSFSLGLGFTESQGPDEDAICGYDDDGDIYRPIPPLAVEWVTAALFDEKVDRLKAYPMFGMPPLSVDTLRSLKPNEELWETVVTAYIKLLIARNRSNPMRGGYKYWVADITFMYACNLDFDDFEEWRNQPDPKGKHSFNGNVLAMLCGGDDEQSAIYDGCQLALIPFLHRSEVGNRNHFSLFLLRLSDMSIIIFDSVHDKLSLHLQTFKRELRIVLEYLPTALRDEYGMQVQPIKKGEKRGIKVFKGFPKQTNSVDCGVFVLKAMDHILRGINKFPPEWSEAQVLHFRYWIAWELFHNRARG